MRGDEPVLHHRRLAPADATEQSTPGGVEVIAGLGLHPAGEAFVKPQVVPPRHRHQIAEPLVRGFVRDPGIDALFARGAGQRGIVEQKIFEGKDRAPVLHRSEELRLAKASHLVELGQREVLSEIVGIIGHQLAKRIERVPALCGLAARDDDADLGAVASLFGDPFEVAKPKEQQVRRHLRGGREGHPLAPAAQQLLARDRHVANRHLRRWNDCGKIEGRFVAGLVEQRSKAARVGCFELGEQPAARRWRCRYSRARTARWPGY